MLCIKEVLVLFFQTVTFNLFDQVEESFPHDII